MSKGIKTTPEFWSYLDKINREHKEAQYKAEREGEAKERKGKLEDAPQYADGFKEELAKIEDLIEGVEENEFITVEQVEGFKKILKDKFSVFINRLNKTI